LLQEKSSGYFVALSRAQFKLQRTGSRMDGLYDEKTILTSYMPSMVHLHLQLRFFFEGSQLPYWFFNPSRPPRGTMKDCTLVVLDSMKRSWRVMRRKEFLVFSVLDLLRLVGVTNSSATSVPDFVFKSGISIGIKICCYNQHRSLPADVAYLQLPMSTNQPLCLLEAVVTERVGVAIRLGQRTNSSNVLADELLGVDVRFISVPSYFEFPDLTKMVVLLTSFAVTLQLSKHVMYFVVSTLLGPTSQVYKDLIQEEASVKSCASWVMEVVTAAAVFSILAHYGQQRGKTPADGAGKAHGTITRKSFCQVLLDGLESNALTSSEIQDLSMFTFKVLLPGSQQDEIGVRDFVKMSMQRESIPFEAIHALIQADLRCSFFERIFADRQLSTSFHSSGACYEATGHDADDDDAMTPRWDECQEQAPLDNPMRKELQTLEARYKHLEATQELIHKQVKDLIEESQRAREQLLATGSHMDEHLGCINKQYESIQRTTLEAVDKHLQEASAKQPVKSASSSLDDWQRQMEKEVLQLKLLYESVVMKIVSRSSQDSLLSQVPTTPRTINWSQRSAREDTSQERKQSQGERKTRIDQ